LKTGVLESSRREKMRSYVKVLLICFLILFSCFSASFAKEPIYQTYKEGELLVKFKLGVGLSTIANSHAKVESKVIKHFKKTGIQLIRLKAGLAVKKAIELYKKDPNVLYAEPNYILYAVDVFPNDPGFSNLWGLHNTGQTGGTVDADIDAPESWQITTGSSNVIVAVIDTGVDYTHQDLAVNMWKNLAELNGVPGVDDDGNGYIDDIYGIDAFNNDTDPMDDHMHGTHCSGTIGAVGNNGIGVAGVNWNVRIMALKFLGSGGGGDTSGAIECLEYAIMMKQDYGQNIRITSNSWGGTEYSQALYDAIQAAGNADILFVAAAGNSYADNDIAHFYPVSDDLPNIIGVAATDHNDNKASFSNWGLNTVDVAAPGVNVLSTTPGNNYNYLSGTSMATPHVSGLGALILAQHPEYTGDQVKWNILLTVDPLDSLDGKILTGGRINANNALNCNASSELQISVRSPQNGFEIGLNEQIIIRAAVGTCIGPVSQTTVKVDFNTGQPTIYLRDDGVAPDKIANDGEYANYWTPQVTPGNCDLILTFTASSPGYPPAFREVQGEAINPVTADFTADNTCILLGSHVNFSDLSHGDILGWLWDFGDSLTSADQNPVHTYTTSGNFNVSLTTTGFCGPVTKVKENYIEVHPSPIAPTVDFSASPIWGFMPLIIAFTDLSRCFAEQWVWNFGEGGTSTEKNPSHTYNMPGTYTVSLTASGPGGSNTEVKNDYIKVIDAGPWPTSGYDLRNTRRSPHLGPETPTIRWQHDTTQDFLTPAVVGRNGFIYIVRWVSGYFLDAINPDGSLEWEFPIPYPYAGFFSPSVWVDTVYQPVGYPSTYPPGRLYAIDPASGLEKWHVDLESEPSTSPYFGSDGTVYIGSNGGKLYAISPETRSVRWSFSTGRINAIGIGQDGTIYGSSGIGYLHAISPNGELKWEFPLCNFSCYGQWAPCQGDTLSIGKDGTIYAGFSIVDSCEHKYSGLLAVNPDGTLKWKKDDFGSPIVGVASPIALGSDDTIYIKNERFLYAFNPDDGEQLWSFNTGSDSETKDSIAVDKNGTIYTLGSEVQHYTYDRNLQAINSDGTRKWLFNPYRWFTKLSLGNDGVVYIVTYENSSPGRLWAIGSTSQPVADFRGNPTAGAQPLTVHFTDQSTGTVYNWQWDFGDGGTSTQQSPSHTYTNVGSYTVIFKVTGPSGSDTKTRTNYIQVYEPPPTIGYSPTSFTFTTTQGGSNPPNQTLSISNTGGGTLTWSVSDNATWLSLNPASGINSGTVTLSVNIAGLTAGIYNATITITAVGATDTPVSIPVTLTINPPPPTICYSPTNLTFTATQGGSNPSNQTLSISNTGGGTLTWSVSDSATWLSLNPTSGTNSGTVTLSVNIAGLTGGTYNATITITATGASNSPVNIPVTLTINAPLTLTIALPNGSEIIPSGSTYTIQWGAPSEAVRFDIGYSLDNGASGTWKLIANNITDHSYNWTVPALDKNNNTCRVGVRAYNSSGGVIGTDTSDNPFTIQVIKITDPDGGETLTSGSTYQITWQTNATVRPVQSVKIYGSPNQGQSGTWKLLTTVSGNPGYYNWTVPIVGTPKDKCRIGVVLLDSSSTNIGQDGSDNNFTIQPAP
jgi:PKD repeat protein/subtilisin family serine protease